MYIYILVVLVAADGVWRDWEHRYATREECLEVVQLITYRREQTIQARCELRWIEPAPKLGPAG
jgi:hypothetical protein